MYGCNNSEHGERILVEALSTIKCISEGEELCDGIVVPVELYLQFPSTRII